MKDAIKSLKISANPRASALSAFQFAAEIETLMTLKLADSLRDCYELKFTFYYFKLINLFSN